MKDELSNVRTFVRDTIAFYKTEFQLADDAADFDTERDEQRAEKFTEVRNYLRELQLFHFVLTVCLISSGIIHSLVSSGEVERLQAFIILFGCLLFLHIYSRTFIDGIILSDIPTGVTSRTMTWRETFFGQTRKDTILHLGVYSPTILLLLVSPLQLAVGVYVGLFFLGMTFSICYLFSGKIRERL